MDIKRYYRVVFRPLLFFGISFFALMLIEPVGKIQENARRPFEIGLGLVIWLFLILGFVSLRGRKAKLYPLRKELRAKKVRIGKGRPGMFSFQFKGYRLFLYGGIAVGLLLALSDLIHFWIHKTGYIPAAVMFPILSLTLFGIALHGVIDGRNYRTLKLYESCREAGNEDDEQ